MGGSAGWCYREDGGEVFLHNPGYRLPGLQCKPQGIPGIENLAGLSGDGGSFSRMRPIDHLPPDRVILSEQCSKVNVITVYRDYSINKCSLPVHRGGFSGRMVPSAGAPAISLRVA